jgi:hypothetical protein
MRFIYPLESSLIAGRRELRELALTIAIVIRNELQPSRHAGKYDADRTESA